MTAKQPDCFVCLDEGWCLWDDDQSRYKAASYGWFVRKGNPEPCQECNRRGTFTLDQWRKSFCPEADDEE